MYLRWCGTKEIKAMVISFWGINLANARSFQQVSSDSSSRDPSSLVKLDLNKLAKATFPEIENKWKHQTTI